MPKDIVEGQVKDYKREEAGGLELVRRKVEVSKEMKRGYISREETHELPVLL